MAEGNDNTEPNGMKSEQKRFHIARVWVGIEECFALRHLTIHFRKARPLKIN